MIKFTTEQREEILIIVQNSIDELGYLNWELLRIGLGGRPRKPKDQK